MPETLASRREARVSVSNVSHGLVVLLVRLELLDEHGPLETVDVVKDAHQEEPVAVTHPLEDGALKVGKDITGCSISSRS